MVRRCCAARNVSCVSETAKGWLAFIAEDHDDGEGPQVATYCPPFADRELRPVDHAAGYD